MPQLAGCPIRRVQPSGRCNATKPATDVRGVQRGAVGGGEHEIPLNPPLPRSLISRSMRCSRSPEAWVVSREVVEFGFGVAVMTEAAIV